MHSSRRPSMLDAAFVRLEAAGLGRMSRPRTASTIRTAVLAVALSLAVVPGVGAQSGQLGYRPYFTKAQEALDKRDFAAYLHNLTEAMSRISPRSVARPYLEYHLARAHAIAGHNAEAIKWLNAIWDERIESLM